MLNILPERTLERLSTDRLWKSKMGVALYYSRPTLHDFDVESAQESIILRQLRRKIAQISIRKCHNISTNTAKKLYYYIGRKTTYIIH